MITECAALIKTHDYRPQRTLENSRLPSFLAEGEACRFARSSMCPHCHTAGNCADYKPPVFDLVVFLSFLPPAFPRSLDSSRRPRTGGEEGVRARALIAALIACRSIRDRAPVLARIT